MLSCRHVCFSHVKVDSVRSRFAAPILFVEVWIVLLVYRGNVLFRCLVCAGSAHLDQFCLNVDELLINVLFVFTSLEWVDTVFLVRFVILRVTEVFRVQRKFEI